MAGQRLLHLLSLTHCQGFLIASPAKLKQMFYFVLLCVWLETGFALYRVPHNRTSCTKNSNYVSGYREGDLAAEPSNLKSSRRDSIRAKLFQLLCVRTEEMGAGHSSSTPKQHQSTNRVSTLIYYLSKYTNLQTE